MSIESVPVCELCGEPMPPGEDMFKFHGYSGPCPKPPLPTPEPFDAVADLRARLAAAEQENARLTAEMQRVCEGFVAEHLKLLQAEQQRDAAYAQAEALGTANARLISERDTARAALEAAIEDLTSEGCLTDRYRDVLDGIVPPLRRGPPQEKESKS